MIAAAPGRSQVATGGEEGGGDIVTTSSVRLGLAFDLWEYSAELCLYCHRQDFSRPVQGGVI